MDRGGLEIQETRVDGCTRLALHGELDISSAPIFRQRLEQLQAERSDVRLDLSGVRFIDSAGMHVLADATNQSRRDHWRVEFEALSPQVGRFIMVAKRAGWRFGF